MVLLILQFIVGLVAIVKGADWLTDGAAQIARRFGIPSIVVGLTIVAIGSSAPELVVSVVAALQSNADMAVGNVVGSNIFNILAILGITAIVKPIKVDRSNVRNDVPFAVLSSVALVICACDSFFGNNTVVPDSISHTDGWLLLCLFAIFMSYTLTLAKGAGEKEDISDLPPLYKSILWCVVGLACLVVGGEWMVDGASGIASSLGVSDSIIALTIVSAGTSAPELAASVMAARKGDTQMALGNIVGSVVFNVFFVLGVSATIFPLSAAGITSFDIITLLVASVLLWVFCRFGKAYYTLSRAEGAVFVVMIIAYYTYLVMQA